MKRDAFAAVLWWTLMTAAYGLVAYVIGYALAAGVAAWWGR